MPDWRSAARLAPLLALASCGGDDASEGENSVGHAKASEAAEERAAPAKAAPERPAPTPHEPPPGVASGFFLDSADVEYVPQPSKAKRRATKPIDLVLRSTPPGAQAAIDGVAIGTTPTFWQGQADGIAHEFTFVKEGYAIARYRFVPTQSGIVHGSLEPLVADKTEGSDAGTSSEASAR